MTNEEFQKAIETVANALNLGIVDLVDETMGPKGLPVRRLEISYNGAQFAVRINPKPREVYISEYDIRTLLKERGAGAVDAWVQNFKPGGDFKTFREVLE